MILDTLWFSLNAILPVVLLVFFGYYLKKIGFLEKYLVDRMNLYVFKIGLPLLLFFNVYQIESLKSIDWLMLLYVGFGVIVFFIIGIFILPLFKFEKGQKNIVLQSFVRTNFGMIGIPLATFIGTQASNSIVSLSVIVTVPVANILSIVIFTMLNEHKVGKVNVKYVVKNIVTNPLIMFVFFALILVFIKTYVTYPTGISIIDIKRDIPFIYQVIETLAKTASPIALLALGGQFEFAHIARAKKAIFTSILFRNFIIPFTMLGITILMLERNENYQHLFPTIIALYGSPVAVSSVVMAQNLGGDHEVASQLVLWTTVVSSITIFSMISMLRFLQYI
jgi:predicted permease